MDYFSKEDKMLIGNTLDKYNRYSKTGVSTYTNFLNSGKLNIITKYLDSKKIEYDIYPKEEFLEKKIIVFGEYLNYITYYKADISDITHSNVLGTLFSLGLEDDMIGDIYVEDNCFYLTNLSRMNEFLEKEFSSIKHKPIKLKRVGEIVLTQDHFKTLEILVSSYRLDNIVSKITNNSRRMIQEMLNNKEILLNYHEVKSSSINLEIGDILSIRKYGKYRIGNTKGQTKKNKSVLEIVKYI